jgi:hypothetical protein
VPAPERAVGAGHCCTVLRWSIVARLGDCLRLKRGAGLRSARFAIASEATGVSTGRSTRSRGSGRPRCRRRLLKIGAESIPRVCYAKVEMRRVETPAALLVAPRDRVEREHDPPFLIDPWLLDGDKLVVRVAAYVVRCADFVDIESDFGGHEADPNVTAVRAAGNLLHPLPGIAEAIVNESGSLPSGDRPLDAPHAENCTHEAPAPARELPGHSKPASARQNCRSVSCCHAGRHRSDHAHPWAAGTS